MPASSFNLDTRIKTLNVVVPDPAHQTIVEKALTDAGGNWSEAQTALQAANIPETTITKLAFAQSLADLSNDNTAVVKALSDDTKVNNLRDVALNYNVDQLTKLVDPSAVAGSPAYDQAKTEAKGIRKNLFNSEPTAVLLRMVQDAELPIADTSARIGLVSFFNNQPDFNIRTTSVYNAIKQPNAFNGITDDQRGIVIEQLKILQRVQAISPVPEAIPVLIQANLTSAFHVAEKTESAFLRAFSDTLGLTAAQQLYTNAVNVHIRNEQALTTIRQTVSGTGLAIFDGNQTLEQRTMALQSVTDQQGVQLNLSTLLGSLDNCECGECLSIYSPAAYFVELLQFLRNNDLDPNNPNTGKAGIAGTPLEKLFRRRPDLGCLELTCENTFTVLPYIDLVNEVMESFVVHQDAYAQDTHVPKQVTLETFNVEGETTGELLGSPQHVNYQAYCTLKSAVYPFTLPYHQPIDATRIFLNYLGTSRWELIDTYRSAHEDFTDLSLSPSDQQEVAGLHQSTIERAVDAEFLGLTQEEYIILTREAFWSKRYFDITQKTTFSETDYQQKIGVTPVYNYYGYSNEADMLSLDESLTTGQKGLTFVKKQFLPRTGLQFADLVELIKTRFINPDFPQGQALTILESIRFSYRFMQTLVDSSSNDPAIKFDRLITFLDRMQPLIPKLDAMLNPNPCIQLQNNSALQVTDFKNWVYCYFDRIGKLIVLDEGAGIRLPLEGKILRHNPHISLLNSKIENMIECGYLNADGTLVDTNAVIIGSVQLDDSVIANDGRPFQQVFPFAPLHNTGNAFEQVLTPISLYIFNAQNTLIGYIYNSQLHDVSGNNIKWIPASPSCDLTHVRLKHLDGTPLTVPEYDRIQLFIRLWRKLSWTINETDQALITGLSLGAGVDNGVVAASNNSTPRVSVAPPAASAYVGFDAFIDDCSSTTITIVSDQSGPTQFPNNGCNPPITINDSITPDFLHQIRAVKLIMDRTGITLPSLLVFWADINTDGDNSLYAKLFLTHNLLSLDTAFKADGYGNYFTTPAKITAHLPVLMATLKRNADDINAILVFTKVPDLLTLSNISVIYRHSLLARILNVRVTDLPDVINLFGNPFKSAWETLAFLDQWRKMEDVGFTFSQLNYLILNHDDPLRPLAPTQKTVLTIAKRLYDSLNSIDTDHPDVSPANKADVTSDFIRLKAGLIFEAAVVEKIIGVLEGTTIYTTNAPFGLSITLPGSSTLSKKLVYSQNKVAASATLQVTGVLTDPEIQDAKLLSVNADWSSAIDRVGKQAKNIFNHELSGVFPDPIDAQNKLLVGDSQDPVNTAIDKRYYFIQAFLPFLRERLSQQVIVDAISSLSGLANDVTLKLLSDILVFGPSTISGMKALEAIKSKPQSAPLGWQGYLIPAIDSEYIFTAISDTQPASIVLDGLTLPLSVQQEDPSNVWSSNAIKLKSGRLYWLQVSDRDVGQLLWNTVSAPSVNIPSSALLPDYTSAGTSDVLVKITKAALIVNGFNLSLDELSYWQSHALDFDGFDLNTFTLQHWKRLEAYTTLRNSLPRTATSLLDLFRWANNPDDPAKLSEKIVAATGWKQAVVDKLIAPDLSDQFVHYDLDLISSFRNEASLLILRDATKIAEQVGVDIDRLFAWAKPGSKFWACHQTAEDIRNALRARFNEDDWEQIVKPLNDQLRENQKQALIDYLVVQPALVDWGVVDADSLFEFLLIDVQMDACMETSRIKQAISSVQLFIQRCMLGLEEKQVNGIEVGVPNSLLDRARWEWMHPQPVWEANKKVWLYAENWMKSELRDDKSPFYKELESALLQKDINTQTVEDALKNYLFKVNEVAHLKVVGFFLDEEGRRLHVFAQTRNAPYLTFYRYYETAEQNWYPWKEVQVDIPGYDLEIKGQSPMHGCYLIPVVWHGRLLIFFPQITKKTYPVNVDKQPPEEKWEIKLAWSEYRNGKWTPKQISPDAYYDNGNNSIDQYTFTPIINNYTIFGLPPIATYTQIDTLTVDVRYVDVGLCQFEYSGGLFTLTDIKPTSSLKTIRHFYSFHYMTERLINRVGEPFLFSFQEINTLLKVSTVSFNEYGFTDKKPNSQLEKNNQETNFYHPFANTLLGIINQGNLDNLFTYFHQQVQAPNDAYGKYLDDKGSVSYHELKSAYSLYNWELAFHAPMLIVDRLVKARQFEQALAMCHKVLSPYAAGNPGDSKRFWQFWPFTQISSEGILQAILLDLQPNQPNQKINEWRNKPFQPHVIARDRPYVYMIWVAKTYINILIEWGDYLFLQDTIESINQATQLYILASHIYGPPGQTIPRPGKVLPETYNSLLDKWDAFGNAMVELELALPYSNQTSQPIGVMSTGVPGLANVFGFASTLYFCIPDNPELKALRSTIDDRLFKIRHCENIQGVLRQLPLFEPPIDPALLVQAAAQGLSLSSVLNDLNSPMPNYRFYYLLQKALEMCAELKSLGSAFLSAKEKGDSELLSQLRAGHESSILNLVMEVKKLQVNEANQAKEALDQSRKGAIYRLQHYLKLMGEDLGQVPDINSDFSGLVDQIAPPISDSGLKLSGSEMEELDKAGEAADWQTGIGVVETLAGVLHLLPDVTVTVPLAPNFSLGTSLGGTTLGNATQAVARGLRVRADFISFQSTNAGRIGGFQRQLQDRVLQANNAGYEIKNIDKQVLTQQIRISIANQEIINQQKQIDNAKEVEDFLRNKYTNEALYSWMEGQVKTLYYQAYTLAYDLAKRAEKVYRFERGLTSSNFIQFGYWDPVYDGLLAGERLYIGLKQIEAAYQEKRGYDFEITKPISLRQTNPLALIDLRETGRCEFELPEVIFDMDFPGHYQRRIKSVSLTIPCVVGPYTSVNATLRLLAHKFRTNAIVTDAGDYINQTDDKFNTVNVPITAIATSSGQNDSGVFELNFKDERYLPFEGAGAISKWRLELSKDFRQFDYDTISDVVLHIRYTTFEGGDKLKAIAGNAVQNYIKSVENLSQKEGVFAAFDLRHDFPDEWYKAMNPSVANNNRVITLKNLNEYLPLFTKNKLPANILLMDAYLFTDAAILSGDISLSQDGEYSFADAATVGLIKSFVSTPINRPFDNWQIKINKNIEIQKLWLIVRYILN